MQNLTAPNFVFDRFTLDVSRRQLRRDGTPVALNPRAFDLLLALVENRGNLLSKEELLERVWEGQIVEESNLTVNMSAIRKALGETAKNPNFITTVSGGGYCFVGNVKKDASEPVEILVETRTVGQIVVEEQETSQSSGSRQFQGARNYRSVVFVISAGAGVVIVLAAVLYFTGFRFVSNDNIPFKAFAVKRLTNSGRNPVAAISPDGKSFVYSQIEPDEKQSLWLADINGGSRVQLVAPVLKNYGSLIFAPDGQRIYYVQFEQGRVGSGTLYRIPVFGGIAEKIRENVPNRIVFAADDSRYAYVRADDNSKVRTLIIAKTDGSSEKEVTSMPLTEGRMLPMIGWSPDGATLAVATRVGADETAPIDISSVDVSTGVLRRLTTQRWDRFRSLLWTKDSKGMIVSAASDNYGLEMQLWFVPFPSGEPRKLMADSNSYSSLDISADNSVILGVQSQAMSNIWVAPADNLAAAKQVTFDMLGKQSGWDGLDWAADGHIIYAGYAGQRLSLWEMDPEGEAQRRLLPDGRSNRLPSVSDDGRYVVFASNANGMTDVWRSNRDGSDMKALTQGGQNENPQISPDGQFVIYYSRIQKKLMRMTIDGANPKPLTSAAADWARYSPDGKSIACIYDVGGKSKLAIIPAEGGDPQIIFDIPTTANANLSVRWTPDGKSVTYRDWLTGIFKQDIAGGEPVHLDGLPSEKLFGYAWSRDGRWFAYSRGAAISDVVLLSNLR